MTLKYIGSDLVIEPIGEFNFNQSFKAKIIKHDLRHFPAFENREIISCYAASIYWEIVDDDFYKELKRIIRDMNV